MGGAGLVVGGCLGGLDLAMQAWLEGRSGGGLEEEGARKGGGRLGKCGMGWNAGLVLSFDLLSFFTVAAIRCLHQRKEEKDSQPLSESLPWCVQQRETKHLRIPRASIQKVVDNEHSPSRSIAGGIGSSCSPSKDKNVRVSCFIRPNPSRPNPTINQRCMFPIVIRFTHVRISPIVLYR